MVLGLCPGAHDRDVAIERGSEPGTVRVRIAARLQLDMDTLLAGVHVMAPAWLNVEIEQEQL